MTRLAPTLILILIAVGIALPGTGRASPAELVEKCKKAAEKRKKFCSEERDNPATEEFRRNGGKIQSDFSEYYESEETMNSQDACAKARDLSKNGKDVLELILPACRRELTACRRECDAARSAVEQMDEGGEKGRLKSELENHRDKTCIREGEEDVQKLARHLGQVTERYESAKKCHASITNGEEGDKDKDKKGTEQEKGKEQQAGKGQEQGQGQGGGGAPQMPSPPSGQTPQQQTKSQLENCQTNPTSETCRRLRENCANLEFALSNEVCVCFNNPKDKVCPQVQATAPQQGGEILGGSGGPSALDGTAARTAREVPRFETAPTRANGQIRGQDNGGLGGGGGGLAGPELEEYDDEPGLNTSILGSSGAAQGPGGTAAGNSKSGSYDPTTGAWIPPRMKDETSEAQLDKLKIPSPGRAPTAQGRREIHPPGVNIWREMNLRYLDVMELQSR